MLFSTGRLGLSGSQAGKRMSTDRGDSTLYVHDLASDEFAIAHINRGGKVTGDNAVAAKFVSCIGVHCVSPDDSAFGGSGSGGAGEPDPGPVCEDLAPVGAECLVDAECCSNKCRGREGARSCK